MRGSIAGRDTFVVDQRTWSGADYQPTGDVVVDQTLIAFRVPSDTICRDRGVLQPDAYWRVEKVDEWIYVFQPNILVKPADLESFIEQARAKFQEGIDPAGYQLTVRPSSWQR